jgi:beta-galactosidase
MKFLNSSFIIISLIAGSLCHSCSKPEVSSIIEFNSDWKFSLGESENAWEISFNDSEWRLLNVPHDWSIEGDFSPDHPATPGGGALPGGIGWYRKSFTLDETDSSHLFFIDFDGVYMDSRVWINGQFLGRRPYGYSSFRYEMTPYLKFGTEENIIAVRVDNSMQPNSRWYSGSGIYRNVWLVKKDKTHIGHWGIIVTTPEVSNSGAIVSVTTQVMNKDKMPVRVTLKTSITDASNQEVASVISESEIEAGSFYQFIENIPVKNPLLWSIENPNLYTIRSQVKTKGKIVDISETPLGIRFFKFDAEKGFLLNGEHVKINGVCNHHDLGCLGTAVNTRALERQLEILKAMGVNAIRTSHNPPAPELLDLCDKMGFIVMDEVFDMWKKSKTIHDYSRFWDEWHERDLKDFMRRDRNHPSIFIWSIGNEILEQWDTSGTRMVEELYAMARTMDTTRPVTTANNPPSPWNNLNKPGIVDLIGYNYAHKEYEKHHEVFPGQKFIATETASALATRGHYDMPSDNIRRWPEAWDTPFTDGNADNTVSAYDHVSAPWGSTHEETWKIIKKHDYLSGMFIWTGFDYLGEPTPYGWPSRSSYFGVVDLAGFPKDSYYMYQSEWTKEPVLHIFPHWNWNEGDTVDVWAYFNCEEVELFLNDKSQGTRKKQGEELHVMWRMPFIPGTLKATGRTAGTEVISKTIRTAGKPARIHMDPDRNTIRADGKDLAFITVEIHDEDGQIVPYADNLINFEINGSAIIAGVDNGNQTSHEPFKANYRKAFNGKCLLVIQSDRIAEAVQISAKSSGIEGAEITLQMK